MILLTIKELEKNYIKENIIVIIYDMIKEYHIIEKLRYFMMNNIINNDKTLKNFNL